MTLTSGSRGAMARVAAVLAAAGLIAAACGSGDTDDSGSDDGDSSPIVLYAPVGESGAFAPSSGPLIGGLKAAVAEINAQGGLLGREVTLEIDNTQSDPTKAVGLLTARLTQEDKPDAVFAGASSVEGLPMLPLLTRDKVISLAPASASDFGDVDQNPYSFSVAPTERSNGEFIAAELKELGHDTIAFLGADSPSANGYIAAYQEVFADEGITVAGYEKYAPDAVDMSGQLERLKSADVDAIVLSGVATTQYVLKSRLKVGMDDLPFIGDSTAHVIDISGTLSDDEKNGYIGQTYLANIPGKGGAGKEKLQAHLADQNFEYKGPLGTSGLSYDVVLAWANAVEAAGSLDVDDVKKAMESDPEQKFDYALFPAEGTGWTADMHFTQAQAAFDFIESLPLAEGQYQVN